MKNFDFFTYHVSWLLNFFDFTLPISIPNRSQMRLANASFDEPANIFMFGILLFKSILIKSNNLFVSFKKK